MKMKLINYTKSNLETGFFLIFAFIMVLLLPIMNSTAEDSFWHFSNSTMNLWGKYMCFAVLAMSLNFVWGYTGLLCLAQNLFFALGGYAFGMYLMRMVNLEEIPSVLKLKGYEILPSIWQPFDSISITILAVLLLPGIVAFIFGYLAFRSRIKGVYFSILTQALTYAATLYFTQSDLFGGTNGFTNFKEIMSFSLRDTSTMRGIFICSGLLMVGCYFIINWMVNSKFGKVQQAIRDSENRVLFSGYSTVSYKLFVFTLASMMAGMAGALYLPQAGIINPSLMNTTIGLDVVVWVALGGRGTKLGPVIGAVCVNFLKSWATTEYAEGWLYILGGLFVFVVLFMPNGIVGLPKQIRGIIEKRQKRQALKFTEETS